MKNQYLYVFILAGFLAGCSNPTVEQKDRGEAPVPVRVMALQQETVYEPVYASGNFTTDDETVRSFKTGGIVQRIFVREGDAVKKGQLLATLDLTEINAQVTQATLAFEKAQRDYNRVKNLYRDSVVTLEQFQNAGTGLDIAKEQLTAARFNLAYSEIRATEDGFVLRKFVNEGQVVGAGTPVFQTNGAGDGNWILRVAVSDGQWSSLSIGDSALITSDLPEMKMIRGKVSRKSEGVDPVSGTFTVDIRPVVNLGRVVASGMFGKATITPSNGMRVWAIPYDALLDADGNTGYVFVTSNSETAKKVNVRIAAVNPGRVLIDGGLEGHTNLIISGSAYLSDQSRIKITP